MNTSAKLITHLDGARVPCAGCRHTTRCADEHLACTQYLDAIAARSSANTNEPPVPTRTVYEHVFVRPLRKDLAGLRTIAPVDRTKDVLRDIEWCQQGLSAEQRHCAHRRNGTTG